MGIESSDEMADFLASQWLAQQKILTLDQLLEKYEAINIAQVNELLPKLAESQRWSFHIEQFSHDCKKCGGIHIKKDGKMR